MVHVLRINYNGTIWYQPDFWIVIAERFWVGKFVCQHFCQRIFRPKIQHNNNPQIRLNRTRMLH